MTHQSPIDYRSRAGRETEVLAEIGISERLSRAWLDAIPQRRAAWFRLLADGRVIQHQHRVYGGEDLILAEVARDIPADSLLSRAARLWDGFVRAFVGGPSF
jgi:hypothetical protein